MSDTPEGEADLKRVKGIIEAVRAYLKLHPTDHVLLEISKDPAEVAPKAYRRFIMCW